MKRSLLAFTLTAALVGTGVSAGAQQESEPNAHPAPIVEGQNSTSGGAISGGAPAEMPAPAEPAQALPPGPPAGAQQATYLSSDTLLLAGAAATALIVCAIACFSNSSSSTTTTTVVHR